MNLAEIARLSQIDLLAAAEVCWARRLQYGFATWGATGNGGYMLGQLLSNGEFDADTTGWTASQSTLASVAGGVLGNALRITENGGTAPRAYQDIELEPDTAYRLSAYAMAGTEADGRLRVLDREESGTVAIATLAIAPSSSAYEHFALDFTTPTKTTGTVTVRIVLQQDAVASSGTTFFYDRAWLVKVADEPHFPHEVHDLLIDNVSQGQRFGLASMDSSSGSWYWDNVNKKLFVHTTAGDSPAADTAGVADYSVVALFTAIYTNKPAVLERRASVITNGGLEWWASASDCEDWVEDVAGSSTIAREATEVYNAESAYSAKLTGDGSNSKCALRNETIRLIPKYKARVVVRYKHSTTSKTGLIYLFDSAANVYWDNTALEWSTSPVGITLPNSTTWAEIDIEFRAHASYRLYHLTVRESDLTSASMYVDSVEAWQYFAEDEALHYLTEIPSVLQGVGDFLNPDARLDFGTLKFNHPEYWAKYRTKWLWHNRPVRLWVGEASEPYDELAPFGTAITRMPKFKAITEIDIDDKQLVFEKLPLVDSRYDNTIPDEAWRGRPKPVLLGSVSRFKPPQIATDGSTYWRYQCSEVTFKSGTSWPMAGISLVYKDDTLLTLTTDYTINLAAGTFDLLADPGSSVISVSAAGVDDDITGVVGNSLLSGFLFMLWHEFNDIPKDTIDLPALVALDTGRLQPLGKWLNQEISSEEFLTRLKISTVSHAFVNLKGKHTAKYFDSDIPSDAPHFYMGSAGNDNKGEPLLLHDTDQCLKWVAVRSQYREYFSVYRYEEEELLEAVGWEHGEHDGQSIDSYLYMQLGAQELSANLMKMFKNPAIKLRVPLGAEAFLLEPFSKAYFTWREIDKNGNEFTYLDAEVFVVTEIQKNMADGTAHVVAVADNTDWVWVFS